MHKLQFLKTQYANLPSQGTDEWLKSRRTKIGGSEIASAIGRCPYRKPKQLVTQKRDTSRTHAPACTFGRIMEYVAKRVLLDDKDMEIHELGAIPCARFPMCYSPDGVIVVGNDLKLIEIKCPFRRSNIDKIPKHYLCQVQAGMNILPCEDALFIQFRIRLCRINQLGTGPKYNRWIHVESYKRAPEAPATHWGYLHFKHPRPITDLGAVGKDNIDSICKIDGMKFDIHMFEKDMPKTGFVMPFKVFKYTIVNVPRDARFLDTHQDTLWNVHRELVVDYEENTPEEDKPKPRKA